MAPRKQREPKEGDETVKGAASYRKIYHLLWEDREFRRLSPHGKNAWFCCLTGSHTMIMPGLSSVSVMRIADQIGTTVATANKALKELEALGWIEFDRNMEVLRIVNVFKYNTPHNDDNVRGWMRDWLRIPACELRAKHLSAFRDVVAGSPTYLGIIDEEIALGRFENRDKLRPNRRAAAGKQPVDGEPLSTPCQDGATSVSTTDSGKRTADSGNTSSLPTVETRVELPSPPPDGAGALTGPARPSFATETQPTTPPPAAPARPTPAIDATGQASLLPSTGKPDRRRKPAGEPEDEPTATADLDRWVARYVELKRPPFPPALTKEDRIFFFQQRKARGIDELVWVLETLHGDAWSAGKTIRQLVSPEAAQKATGLNAKSTQEPAFRSNKYAQAHEQLDDVWQQPNP
jgi:hypothetical protein